MTKKKISFLLLLISISVGAQTANGTQMADAMRSNGKIYVVISVVAIIFLSLALFLVYIERRIKKIEKEIEKK